MQLPHEEGFILHQSSLSPQNVRIKPNFAIAEKNKLPSLRVADTEQRVRDNTSPRNTVITDRFKRVFKFKVT